VRSKEVTSHWTMISSITVSLLILTISLSEIKGSDVTLNDDLQYHSQFVDTDNIAQWDQRKWRHTERWFPVSQSVGWYWQYRSVRSKENQWDQRKSSEIKGKPVRSKDRSVRSKENYPNEQ
jgi:hypothetical protein